MNGDDWLSDIAEIDYIAWRIKEMSVLLANRTPLDMQIDRATGREKALADEAADLMARFRELTGSEAAPTP